MLKICFAIFKHYLWQVFDAFTEGNKYQNHEKVTTTMSEKDEEQK